MSMELQISPEQHILVNLLPEKKNVSPEFCRYGIWLFLSPSFLIIYLEQTELCGNGVPLSDCFFSVVGSYSS